MNPKSPDVAQVTQLLVAWNKGDQAAFEQLSAVVQAELHRLARRYLAGERPGHTLQPTALINEAWLRLIDWRNVSWQNRAHFFAVSAQLMRHVLVEHARRRAAKANASHRTVTFDEALEIPLKRGSPLLALDDALKSLAEVDPRKARIVELRFFGGLNEVEVAEMLEVSPKTIQREWNKAKAWLYFELTKR